MPGINWSGNVKHWHLADGETDTWCAHPVRGPHGSTSDIDAVTCVVCLRSRVKTLVRVLETLRRPNPPEQKEGRE